MNTLHFKYALEVEKTGSITQAADNLYMGQPSLSKAIKELEDTLKIEIFKRSSRGMVPTEEGAKFLQYARNVLIQLDNMEQISAENNGPPRNLRIAYPHSSYLFQAAKDFSTQIFSEQPLELEILELPTKKALQLVLEGKLNFSIIRLPKQLVSSYQDYCKTKGLKMEFIWEFDEVVIASAKSPLLSGGTLREEAFNEYICVDFGKQNIPPLVDELFDTPSDKEGTKCHLTVHSASEALSFVASNPASYLLGEPLAKELSSFYNLNVCPFKEASTYQDFLLYPANHSFRSVERLFIDKVYEQKNHIVL